MDKDKKYCHKITINTQKSNEKPFLIFEPEQTLTSQSLVKILGIGSIDTNFLDKMMNNYSDKLNRYFKKVTEISTILHEDNVYYNFDPYGNFLLSNRSDMNEIKDIMNKIKNNTVNNTVNNTEKDFSEDINPYGLSKVVFTGGGTKGLIYIGALIGLFATGQIFYLNHFSGTSAGALTAMILGCITPSVDEYNVIKNMTLKDISRDQIIISKYQKAIRFVIEKFCDRDIDTFYNPPICTFFGIWDIIDKIIKDNGLYDPKKSGFMIWYALICKTVCCIMENGLDSYIIIKKKDGMLVEINNTENYWTEYDSDNFEGWELVKFFTFKDYYDRTAKTLVLTGTKTSKIETVYYTHTNTLYKDLSVCLASMASMSIPWIFKAPIIDGSYNLDGGIYDNYPLTHCDKKIKDRITHYNNQIFGYLIDDKNSIIDVYEIIRELWLVYNGFIEIMKISYIYESANFVQISELFFEIRSDIYKLLYFTDIDFEHFVDFEHLHAQFNMNQNVNILSNDFKFGLMGLDMSRIRELMYILSPKYKLIKIGKKTKFTEMIELSIEQGKTFNILMKFINHDIELLNGIENKDNLLMEYEHILNHIIEHIMMYYELKGIFVKNNDLDCPSLNLSKYMKNLYTKISLFEKMTINATDEVKKKKNYINTYIQIAYQTIIKILTKDSEKIESLDNRKSSYQKVIDYFFHTDMTGIFYKYMCIANDKICNDTFNDMRTIKLNTFETSTLHFNMEDDLKARLLYEGYSKTIKFFASIIHIMEISGKSRSTDEYLESYELRFKKLLMKL